MAQTILVIDDNQDDILITRRVLAKNERELSLEVALSGEAGLSFLQETGTLPALILLDLKMPGMDGFEVLRRIRSDERLHDIPVIVVTHSALESDVAQSYRNGANAVLHKAFDIDQFRREMNSILERWLVP